MKDRALLYIGILIVLTGLKMNTQFHIRIARNSIMSVLEMHEVSYTCSCHHPGAPKFVTPFTLKSWALSHLKERAFSLRHFDIYLCFNNCDLTASQESIIMDP